ncbi:hypothetical protein Cs7R123_11470 [Catellatospora sp. TT07R-123]|uniref:hypothetical protein n=1 Tax=Catellatospora sp. TT07R-123 TaxID=2733863 RepID=UPI001B1E7726|nr:hypothetical protein [Catellatospora sp. TT07R-123]GHJ43805.1 hypothetical protein Cs7R123_11470 [Catellatospora sp. TT07R-123]
MTFEQDKRRLMAAGTPSDGDNLTGMSMDFDAYLFMSELFAHVEVRRTGDPDCLLVATCTAAPGATPTSVAEGLVDVWLRHLQYHHRSAHRLRQDAQKVYLDVVTLMSAGGIYVTGLIEAGWKRDGGDGPVVG